MTARLRFPTERSRLRRHSEPEEPIGYRGPFQRDRDRVIHSRAFRRLAGKTQVTTLPDSNHCRSRLTHTIEVAQVARTVATTLGLNVDLVEALALAHDLGHPAFGHAGEMALDREMREHGLSFNHNFHALRIVEHFEQRYAPFRGLNLTFEVREGLLKHSCDLSPDDPTFREYLPDLRPTLEAQLIDPADEIAYLSADMEDAVEGGFLRIETVCKHVPAFADLYTEVRSTHPIISDRRVMNEAQRRLVGILVTGLIEGTRSEAESSGAPDCDAVRRLPRRIAVPSEPVASTMRQMHSLLAEAYYNAARLQRIARGYASKLAELFRFYVEHPESLPEKYVEQLAAESLPQVVCDYIAGMTDIFLLRCYAECLGGRHSEELQNAPA